MPPCRRWQSTHDRGITWEQRVEQLTGCTTCDGRGPAREEDLPAVAGEADQEMLARVEYLVAEQQAGRRFKLSELTGLEWELMVVWQRYDDAHRRLHQVRMKGLFEMMAARLKSPM